MLRIGWKRARRNAAPMPPPPRDTDRDWRIIGDEEPYFGVLTHDRFRRANLDAAALDAFFATGRSDVEQHLARVRELTGPFEPRSALDFGCGVGRLTRALAALTGDAVGVDISPGMLREARRYTGGGAQFVERIGDERRFDWVMSLIVLQHVTPEHGYPLIRSLARAVAPGGGLTLQLTFARLAVHDGVAGGRLLIDGDDVRPVATGDVSQLPPGTMLMHDYDLSHVVALLFAAGLTRLHLEQTDHGGAIGAVIYARRD